MSFHPRYAVDNGGARPDHSNRRPVSPREKAIEAASRCFSVQEYQALVHDIEHGRVDVRLYDDGLVLTWDRSEGASHHGR
jgi:hypothetical protein